MKKLLFIVLEIVVVGVVVFLFSKNNRRFIGLPVPAQSPTGEKGLPYGDDGLIMPAGIVTYTNVGYSPSTPTIQKGQTVAWKNKGSSLMWIASAMHPTHKIYPDSDVAKCGTSLQAGIFDACKGYGAGESWEFKFDERGTWKYHNHLQSNHTGTITVE